MVEGASHPLVVMLASLRQVRRARRLRRGAADLATRVLNCCSDSTDVVLMPQLDTRPTRCRARSTLPRLDGVYRFIEHRCCPLRLRPPRCCRPTSSCAACVLLGIVATCLTLALRTPRHPPRGLRPSARGDDSRRLQEDPRLPRRREHCITRRRGPHPAVADRSRHEPAPPPTDAADFATNQASTAALLARGTEPLHISGHIIGSISEQRRIASSTSRPMPTNVAMPAPHSWPRTTSARSIGPPAVLSIGER